MREKLDSRRVALVELTRDQAYRDLHQEKEDLRNHVKRWQAKASRFDHERETSRRRCLSAEADARRVSALLPRSDSRVFLAVAGISGDDDMTLTSGESMLVQELREEVARLRADRDDDARRIASLTAKVDGLEAVLLEHEDGFPDWLAP